jgi:hypothetical protein
LVPEERQALVVLAVAVEVVEVVLMQTVLPVPLIVAAVEVVGADVRPVCLGLAVTAAPVS